mmetsp:Transcript_95059/g.307687  ORF Transcript_95059/g.307687 Transcript_95059/m.307687 type:complete len:200 (+) Transcript_95059:4115-4714(+)
MGSGHILGAGAFTSSRQMRWSMVEAASSSQSRWTTLSIRCRRVVWRMCGVSCWQPQDMRRRPSNSLFTSSMVQMLTQATLALPLNSSQGAPRFWGDSKRRLWYQRTSGPEHPGPSSGSSSSHPNPQAMNQGSSDWSHQKALDFWSVATLLTCPSSIIDLFRGHTRLGLHRHSHLVCSAFVLGAGTPMRNLGRTISELPT